MIDKWEGYWCGHLIFMFSIYTQYNDKGKIVHVVRIIMWVVEVKSISDLLLQCEWFA